MPDNRLRKKIAQEAAKLVAVEGLDNYLIAKKKAAQQLGINNNKLLPSNTEIEFAIIEYQSLFHKNDHDLFLNKIRQITFKAMDMLKEYEPRLVGPVLSGTANQYSEITLHLFSDTSEYVALFLEKKGIPFEICERRLVIDKNKPAYFTAYKFIADNIEVVLIILPLLFIKKPPVDPISRLTMRRARISEVKKLINP